MKRSLSSRLPYFVLMISREKFVRFPATFEGQPSETSKSYNNNTLIFLQRGPVLPGLIYIFSVYLQFITSSWNPFPARRLTLK